MAGSAARIRSLCTTLPSPPRLRKKGDYLRFHGTLPGADRELAILTTARELDVRYEWQAHEPIARREGAAPEAIEVARSRGAAESLRRVSAPSLMSFARSCASTGFLTRSSSARSQSLAASNSSSSWRSPATTA